jgi:hypothetical protein
VDYPAKFLQKLTVKKSITSVYLRQWLVAVPKYRISESRGPLHASAILQVNAYKHYDSKPTADSSEEWLLDKSKWDYSGYANSAAPANNAQQPVTVLVHAIHGTLPFVPAQIMVGPGTERIEQQGSREGHTTLQMTWHAGLNVPNAGHPVT